MSRSPTPPRTLKPRQQIVAALLAAGRTETQAAAEARCSRRTIGRWLHDPVFVAAVDAARNATWSSHLDRLRGLVGKAVTELEFGLRQSDPRLSLRAAQLVLQTTGVREQLLAQAAPAAAAPFRGYPAHPAPRPSFDAREAMAFLKEVRAERLAIMARVRVREHGDAMVTTASDRVLPPK
ncbi:MAG: helix-turn-helix domain-containing protein [Deltaproteobacteria bacterium]|nr:helix-turn-helix domain-containing protein [Deltaproteobacteria bacterium]